MKRTFRLGTIWSLGICAACTSHTVKVDPVEVKPIYVKVDINIKVDRELDRFFDFEEGIPDSALPGSRTKGGGA